MVLHKRHEDGFEMNGSAAMAYVTLHIQHLADTLSVTYVDLIYTSEPSRVKVATAADWWRLGFELMTS